MGHEEIAFSRLCQGNILCECEAVVNKMLWQFRKTKKKSEEIQQNNPQKNLEVFKQSDPLQMGIAQQIKVRLVATLEMSPTIP